LSVVLQYLKDEGWGQESCVVCSQYYDTASWVAKKIATAFPGQPIGLYAGSGKSMVLRYRNSLSSPSPRSSSRWRWRSDSGHFDGAGSGDCSQIFAWPKRGFLALQHGMGVTYNLK